MIDGPLVPVVERGKTVEVGLGDALVRAHEFEGIAVTEAPTMPIVLLRLLLAVTIHAFGLPRSDEEWEARFDAGRFDAEVLKAYLEGRRDRFDAFDPVAPFGQVAGLRTGKDEVKPITQLVPSVASGNTPPLFSARTEGDEVALPLSVALRLALHVQVWDTAGIKTGAVGDDQAKSGKTTGNPVGVLGWAGPVHPTGRNLFETLLLNTPIVPDGLASADQPIWDRPPLDGTWKPDCRPIGLLELLTWSSRRVRLVPDADGAITGVVVTGGDRLARVPDFEPHTAWRLIAKPKPDDPPSRPARHQPGRAAWRGLDALLAVESSANGTYRTSPLLEQIGRLTAEGYVRDDYPLGVAIVGVEYGTQSAIVEHVMADEIPLPVVALRGDPEMRELLQDVVKQVDDLVTAVDLLDADLRRASGGDPTPWDAGQRPGTRLVHQFDSYVRRLLAGLQADPDELDRARDAWARTARRLTFALGDQIVSAVPPQAFRGRSEGEKHPFRVSTAERAFRRRVAAVVPVPERESDEGNDRSADDVGLDEEVVG